MTTKELEALRQDSEEKSQACPECGGQLEFGECPDCGYVGGGNEDAGSGDTDGEDDIE